MTWYYLLGWKLKKWLLFTFFGCKIIVIYSCWWMIMWCTGRTGQKEDFTLWKQHHWIPTLSLDCDCCLAVALALLKPDCGKRFPSPPKYLLYFLLVSVFTSRSFSVLCLPYSPKSVFHYQVEDASKGILIFLPVDCMGWKTLEGFFFMSPLHLQFLFMACHYLLQPFIPSPSLSFSLSIDLILWSHFSISVKSANLDHQSFSFAK